MVITDKTWLPTYEELEVEEVPLGSPALRAGSNHLGKYCEFQNNEFMLCKWEYDKDPRKCLDYGKQVTACTLEFFRKVKKACYNEFEHYAHCIDKSSHTLDYQPCRRTEAAFDKCMLENMGIERPSYDYYCRPKVHESVRPAPPKKPLMVFENVPPTPDEAPAPLPPKYGLRLWFLN